MRTVRRYWTVIGKIWALPFIFVGGGLLTIIGMPVMALMLGRCDNHALSLIRGSFRMYLWMLHRFGFVRIQIEGKERLQAAGGRIVVANHPSLLDVVILIALIPRPQCIVKNQLWNHRFLGGLMRAAGFIRNDLEPEELMAACKQSIDAGCSLIIFPEGTRTVPGTPPHFHRGFANIAIGAHSPIVPVVIECTPPFLYKGEPWWRPPLDTPVFTVHVGESLDLSTIFGYVPRSLAARKLSELLENYYGRRIHRCT